MVDATNIYHTFSRGKQNLHRSSDAMYKTHKITLDPTFRQRHWFSQQSGYARLAYNHALSDFKVGLCKDNFQSWQTCPITQDWMGPDVSRVAFYWKDY